MASSEIFARVDGSTVVRAQYGRTFYRVDSSNAPMVEEAYIRTGVSTVVKVFGPPAALLTSATGTIIDGTNFTFAWTISGTTTGFTLRLFHVPSDLELTGGIANPSTSSSTGVFTSNSGDEHRAELYDDSDTLVNAITFTPEL